ncbi:hypothetical protein SAMD00019534_112240 [Acytostelium subglobosum LB1]|uniref:hypothetical protein n=1 Tax=Acytostelium subglobosum LB1 TaxID=1410327 RepID=UPI000644D6ED|nr:hypothetical protein SAMD00019534_112240 [Acytostelium subglobosum LB1]GAM28048.1 hypothetical protein SAMD00019534_112240 [Acytostelium subglobosum LB1]|eukprot:XP_012749007.1 hypothetical protein SAMD00019534_112240 [Acytostelium subglobosum LB1]
MENNNNNNNVPLEDNISSRNSLPLDNNLESVLRVEGVPDDSPQVTRHRGSLFVPNYLAPLSTSLPANTSNSIITNASNASITSNNESPLVHRSSMIILNSSNTAPTTPSQSFDSVSGINNHNNNNDNDTSSSSSSSSTDNMTPDGNNSEINYSGTRCTLTLQGMSGTREDGVEMTTMGKPGSLQDENSRDGATADEDNKVFEELYSKNQVGWKGWKTIRLMAQRYLFGLIVACFVSLAIYILSLPQWTGPANSEVYFNTTTYTVFFQFAVLLFGPIYILLGLLVSYGFVRVRDSKILYYSIGIIFFLTLFYMVLYLKGISYWFYYIDALGVVIMYVLVEFLFAYNMSLTLQAESAPNDVSVKKAYKTAYNYSAPDIVVTVFTVVYMFFLLPVYFSIQNDLLRLGWRLVVHPVYWTFIVVVARQFLTRDISTDDIMLNTNIVLHTFFHHQTLGKIFVYTFSGDEKYLTEVGMIVAAIEEILLRAVALKRDEWVLSLFYGRTRAKEIVYSQQSLQLRAAILNIQVALEFSGLITAPIFIYLFQKWRMLFHFFDTGDVIPLVLFYQSLLSIGLDFISELTCTYVECRFFKLPIAPTWKWMKSHKWFLCWLIYGSLTMGLLGMLWTCARVPRAGLCASNDICSCNNIIATSLPAFCMNKTMT